jgi:hypothetical protein
MRKLIVILTMFSVFESFGQPQVVPTYYLNGDSININTCFINPLSIDDIKIDKKIKHGIIYLSSKKLIEFFTLDDIRNKYTSLKEDTPIVFIIDGKIVIDRVPVRIDRSYYIYVVTKPFKDITYIDQSLKDVILVEITLSTQKIEPKIIIRGEEFRTIK